MSAVWETVIATGWFFLALLYRAVLPAYIIFDSLANNLNDFRVALNVYEWWSSGGDVEEFCKARGITPLDLDDDLRRAEQMSSTDVANAILTAAAILVGIISLIGIIVCKFCAMMA